MRVQKVNENQMSPEQVASLIQGVTQEISDVPVWYALKAWKFKPLRPDTMKFVKSLLVMHCAGFESFSASLIIHMTGTSLESARLRLHILGDKHIITWVRGKSGKSEHRWYFNSDFLSHVDLREIRKVLEEKLPINGESKAMDK